jgi:uncharacterized protein (DUF2141 family)
VRRPLHLVFALLVALSPAGAAAEETGTLTVVVTGFASEKGEVLIQLANSRADYEADDTGFRAARVKPTGEKIEKRFDRIPYGEYALKIFHDENSNEELDIGWMGPEERYGFSNGARGTFGPPDWDEAKFTFGSPEATAKVELE